MQQKENTLEFLKVEVSEILSIKHGQFDCATDNLFGRYNPQNIYNMEPTDIHYYIADWAIAGNRLPEIGICLWYLNPFRPTCGPTFPYNGSGTLHTRLGDHCFYRPTELYANT